MCGIGGILRTDGKRIPETWLAAIDERVAYRGPDGTGRFHDRVELSGENGPRVVEVAFVHRRLSIIDHQGGGQPMVSKRGRSSSEGLLAVVFNGCIYNHRELRRELEAAGHAFTSDHSDTEVLLHGYRQWGEAVTEHLEGMYAFGLWDHRRGALILARDWFGEKPLYMCRSAGGQEGVIAFASDARALAALGASRQAPLRERIDPLWIDTYLGLGYNHGGRTPFVDQGGGPIAATPPTIAETIDELMGTSQQETQSLVDFEALLDQAVARRLEADVPLGCFLSGGVDSSLVAHFARAHLPELRTFTVRMPDERYDESRYAEQVAQHLGTTHSTLDVAVQPAEDLAHLVRTLGQPFGDSSILPTYWVARAAVQHVKVALSGDGGDELFVGYDRYVAARHLTRHRRALCWLPRSLLEGSHPKSWRTRLGRLGEMARDMPALGILAMESLFTQAQIVELLGGLPERRAAQAPGFDPMQSLRRADLVEYLPNDLLVKVDTASMAVALEVRAPFLDRDLVRAALSSPTWQLVPGGRRKGFLREIARRHLPEELVDRPKMGFAVPIGQWFRNDFGSMRTLLLAHLHASEPFGPMPLDRKVVRRLVDEHLACRRDHGQRLFALLTLSMWARGL